MVKGVQTSQIPLSNLKEATEEQRQMFLRIMSKKTMDIVKAADYVGVSIQTAKQILL
jgi:flagellar motor switch protein FliG